MVRTALAAAASLTAGLLAACAAEPAAPPDATKEPLAHEYRTGSIRAQKDKHVTTEEERQRAQEIAAEIRAAPQTIVGRP